MFTTITAIVGLALAIMAIGISIWVALVAKNNLTLAAYSAAIQGGILNLKSTFAEDPEIFERQIGRNSDIAGLIPEYMIKEIPEFLAFAGGMWRFSYVFSVIRRRRSLGLSVSQYIGLRNEMELWLENIPGFYDVYRSHTSKLRAHDPAFLSYLESEVYTQEFCVFAESVRRSGTDSRETLVARNDLAISYKKVGRLDKAITVFGRTLEDCMRVLGPKDELTEAVQANLREAQNSAAQLAVARHRRPWRRRPYPSGH